MFRESDEPSGILESIKGIDGGAVGHLAPRVGVLVGDRGSGLAALALLQLMLQALNVQLHLRIAPLGTHKVRHGNDGTAAVLAVGVLALVDALVDAEVLALVEADVLAEVEALVEADVLAEVEADVLADVEALVLALVDALVEAEVLAEVEALVLAEVLALVAPSRSVRSRHSAAASLWA